jgi:AcrR family transcriptional regulator
VSRTQRRPPASEKSSSSPGPASRSGASRRRRYAIAGAAIKLFGEHGLEGTTVDDIAAAAGVSPRTFFRHFETKEQAAFPDHDERIAELRAQLAAHHSSLAPLRVVIELSRQSAHQFLEDPDLYRPRIQLVRANPALRDRERLIDQRYESALAEYLKAELADDPAAGLKSHVIAAAIVAAVNHTNDRWASDPTIDAELLLADALRFVEDAFSPLVRPGTIPHDEDVVVVVASSSKLRADLAHALADVLPPARERRRRGRSQAT